MLKKTSSWPLVLCSLAAIMSAPTASSAMYDEEQLSKQRAEFIATREAIRLGRNTNPQRVEQQWGNYPLYPYLEYEFLRKKVNRAPDEDIIRFLQTYSDSPLAERIRGAWLLRLARASRWDTFFEYYQPGHGSLLRCIRANGLFKTGRVDEAMAAADELWLSDKPQPPHCDLMFGEWKRRGGMNRDMVWKRIALVMDKGRISFAQQLAKDLPKADAEWINPWIEMHHRPAPNLLRKVFRANNPQAREIFRHGVTRLASRDVGTAAEVWDDVRAMHQDADPEATNDVDQSIAMRAAAQRHPRALELLSRIEKPNERTLDWRVRAALTQQDWWTALTWIEGLPAELRDSEQWRYWRARVLEMQSRELPVLRTAAERIFSDLSKQRSYHGFLAADRLGLPYEFASRPLDFSEDELSVVADRPVVRRAYELYKLGLTSDARREWIAGVATMNDKELQMVSLLASRWGWYDRAILTIAKSAHADDLDVRFPMAYKEEITDNAGKRNIDPAWVYGVLRQESSFMPDARSGVGALGLMQLMPLTGRVTARQTKTRIMSNRDILEVSKNIHLGTAYLKQLYDQHGRHSALATAAYNAGPHRVKKWMPAEPTAADLWVEAIPFSETRNYVQRVMAYTVIYDYRLNGQADKIRNRMPVVSRNQIGKETLIE